MTLESSKIIPDVVDHVKKTKIKMDIKYKYDHVENGVTLRPDHVRESFKILIYGSFCIKLYFKNKNTYLKEYVLFDLPISI